MRCVIDIAGPLFPEQQQLTAPSKPPVPGRNIATAQPGTGPLFP